VSFAQLVRHAFIYLQTFVTVINILGFFAGGKASGDIRILVREGLKSPNFPNIIDHRFSASISKTFLEGLRRFSRVG
jgi:hypothetical protein